MHASSSNFLKWQNLLKKITITHLWQKYFLVLVFYPWLFFILFTLLNMRAYNRLLWILWPMSDVILLKSSENHGKNTKSLLQRFSLMAKHVYNRRLFTNSIFSWYFHIYSDLSLWNAKCGKRIWNDENIKYFTKL